LFQLCDVWKGEKKHKKHKNTKKLINHGRDNSKQITHYEKRKVQLWRMRLTILKNRRCLTSKAVRSVSSLGVFHLDWQ
jgi:hypothetical protein